MFSPGPEYDFEFSASCGKVAFFTLAPIAIFSCSDRVFDTDPHISNFNTALSCLYRYSDAPSSFSVPVITPLTANRPTTGHAEFRNWIFYTFESTGHAFQIRVTQPNREGDVDVYVRKNERPDAIHYDYADLTTEADISVDVPANNQATRWCTHTFRRVVLSLALFLGLSFNKLYFISLFLFRCRIVRIPIDRLHDHPRYSHQHVPRGLLRPRNLLKQRVRLRCWLGWTRLRHPDRGAQRQPVDSFSHIGGHQVEIRSSSNSQTIQFSLK
jgi:hypothetical protein